MSRSENPKAPRISRISPLAPEPYNPLDLRTLAESMVAELLKKRARPLAPLKPFQGAGVYAIYYKGEFEPYQAVALENRTKWKMPIYVGKAAGRGSRKGGSLSGRSPGKAMFERLRQHAESIRQAHNLSIDDFACRYLVTLEVFIPLCESLLIDRYKPIWNVVIEGFGPKVVGEPRRGQQTSMWDILHPGRTGRGEKTNKRYKSAEDVKNRLTAFFLNAEPRTADGETSGDAAEGNASAAEDHTIKNTD